MSSNSFATDNTDVVDNVNITVPVSCSLEGTGMTSHNANIVNGTYQADIGSTTLKAFCNDDEGFAIYAIGYTDNEYGKTVLTNSTLGSTYDIATGTATSGNTSNWAMKLATNASATYAVTLDNGFGAYSSVPSAYTKVAHRDSGTDIGTTATGAELTTTYAAFVNQTQPAGTYIGKVIYTLVHPANADPGQQEMECDPGKICYNPNTATALGEMGRQSASNNASVDLWASNFSRTGYGFAGWNDKFDYSGNYYGPNETITAPSDVETNGLSFYAVWIKSAGSIQNWNGCNSLASGATTALTDERDNQTYAVAKLADGKCWMIENLRLDNTASHNTDGSLAQGYNSSFIGLADPESADFSNSTTANSLYSTDGSTAATISDNYQGYRFPRYNNFNTSSKQSSSGYSASGNTYSMGNYYTWHAAIADTTYYNTNNQSIENTSLCPAGWRLPKGGKTTVNTTADFYILGKALMNNQEPDQNASNGYGYYGSTLTNTSGDTATKAFRKYPNNFLYSGVFNDSSAFDRGSRGYYWSSTVRDYGNSYGLYLGSSNVFPGTDYDYKSRGDAIRCTLGS